MLSPRPTSTNLRLGGALIALDALSRQVCSALSTAESELAALIEGWTASVGESPVKNWAAAGGLYVRGADGGEGGGLRT